MLDAGDKRNRDDFDNNNNNTIMNDDKNNNNDHVDTGGGGDGRGQLASQQYLQVILEQFPPVMYAFGYGSGVFSQQASLGQQKLSSPSSSSSSLNHTPGMLDIIFVVDDPTSFHKQNMKLWPEHYASWLRYVDGGTGLVCSNLQTHGLGSLLPFPSSKGWLSDAHVLFHVVDDKPAWMKYGVISQKDIVNDLTGWESLYIAGRMQKPTLSISSPSDELLEAQQTNLDAAVAAALLLSPISSSSLATTTTTTKGKPCGDEGQKSTQQNNILALSWPTFFQTVASISYSGDFRMKVGGEDPRKLRKLVEGPGQLSRFCNLYQPSVERLTQSGVISSSAAVVDHNDSNRPIGQIEWDYNDESSRKHLLSQLPHSVQKEVQLRIHHPSSSPTTSGGEGVAIALAQTLAGIVGPAARNQSFKGLFTLGMRKSIRYAKAKLSKGLLRKR